LTDSSAPLRPETKGDQKMKKKVNGGVISICGRAAREKRMLEAGKRRERIVKTRMGMRRETMKVASS
jgi:hypothetical protein